MKTSFLIPTRERKEMLEKSILSIMETADNPSEIELLLGVDNDDQETADYVANELPKVLEGYNNDTKVLKFNPLGYGKLHEYVNALCGYASGDYLVLWNDDCILQTKGWDTLLSEQEDKFAVFKMNQTNHPHPYALFPIVPIDWYLLIGYFSLNAQNDAWVSTIAKALNVLKPIDIDILHDRFDLTGNNDDDTFRNRVYKEGNPSDPEDFQHPNMTKAREHCMHKLSWFCGKIGQPETQEYFNKVLTNEVNPYEEWQEERKNAKGVGSGL